MFSDVTSSALHTALSGLAYRQRVIATNIANVETPGFRAGKVQFEQALSAALADGSSPDQVEPTFARSLEPTRLNGSNVNLDEESLSSLDTNMRYQLALRAMDSKFGLLSTVIKGSR